MLLIVLIALWALVPLAGAATRWLGPRAGVALGLLLLAAAGAFAWLGRGLGDGGEPETLRLDWIRSIEVELALRLDGVALLFTLLVMVVGAAVLIFSAGYFDGGRTGSYYPLMVGFAAAMTTLVLADDLVLLFIAWELTTLCSYLLILRCGPPATGPATRTLLITVGGGLALLGAVTAIIVGTGTTRLSEALQSPIWSQNATFATTVTVLIVVAAATKAAQFPFHFWLPEAMVAPAPVSAYLHAAAMVKAGIFLLMRFAEGAAQSAVWVPLLITIGLASLFLGAVFALQRNDLKELLAYSTISHLGLIVVVIGAGGPDGLEAASVHVAAHGIFKAGAFMYIGYLDKVAGTRDIRELSGLWSSMRLASICAIVLAAAMAGVPLTFGFISKEAILAAVVDGPGGLAVAVALAAAAALTVAYSARLVFASMAGRAGADQVGTHAGRRGAKALMLGPIAAASAATLALGPLPGLLNQPIQAAGRAMGVDDPNSLYLWHGVNTALILSMSALLVGSILVAGMRGTHAAALRLAPPFSGPQITDALQRGTIRGGEVTGRLGAGQRPAAHLVAPTAVIAIVGGVGVAASWESTGWPSLAAEGYGWIDAGLLALVATGCVVTVRAANAITMVLAAGIAGLGVGLWFFTLGASDVALTQLLVEFLTVVVMVIVVRHLPGRFPPVTRNRSVMAAVIAVAVGVVTTIAVARFTSRTQMSWAGQWYLENATEETGGENIVNTILVDFRAFDTFGELVVLALAAISITALLDARPRLWLNPGKSKPTTITDPSANAVFLQVAGRVVIPLLVLTSAYTLIRGHNAPGGGFIAALLGAAALAVVYLSASSDRRSRLRWPAIPIAGAGVLIAVVTGLVGYLDGSFLRPLTGYLFGYHFTTALVFDVGVYLAVFGVILGALNRLGTPPDVDPELPEHAGGDRTDPEPARAGSGGGEQP